jgi:hypothetical protein
MATGIRHNPASPSLNANQITAVSVNPKTSSSSFSQGGAAYGGSATVNNTVRGGNGGFAVNEGNSVSINTPHQWPSGFATGFSSSSPAGCKIGMGLNGGYGGATIPIDDEDCELAVAAQMALSIGDVWGYCKLMSQTEAYEIAKISTDDCFSRNGVSTVSTVQPSGKVTEPLQSYKDIKTPALDRLKN